MAATRRPAIIKAEQMAPEPEPTPPVRLTVDLGALADNWRELAAMAPDAETSAVVKANGYGIGVEQAAAALRAAGCRAFFVATAAEGERVRPLVGNSPIYLLDGLLPGNEKAIAGSDLRPVLGSPAEIAEWAALRQAGLRADAAIQIDTGMNRQGLSPDEARALASDADLLATIAPVMVMSHLACADEPGHDMNERQRDAFAELASLFPGAKKSLANSAGVMLGPNYHFDLTRPGIALYGARAVIGRAALKPVVTAEAYVLRVRDAAAGETVGYGATQRLTRPSRLATLAVGYADGYHRAAGSSDGSPGASVAIRGEQASLVGRVSMDLMVADVTDITGVTRGDWAELFGRTILIDDVADRAGTIGYELLTDLGRRYRRQYVGG
jgi:alanine racemase